MVEINSGDYAASNKLPGQALKQEPDFLILGAMKAGTTALFNYLGQHPQIVMPSVKELHYYDQRRYTGWNVHDYICRFPRRNQDVLSGESTPFYLRHPHAPKWVRHDFPDIRLIVILRNPTERAYSHYQQRIRNGKTVESLQNLVSLEQKIMEGRWRSFFMDETDQYRDVIELSYLSRGRYLEQLEHWLEYFPRTRFLIIFSEELYTNQVRELNRVAKFLDISAFPNNFSCPPVKVGKYDSIDKHSKTILDDYFAPYNEKLFEFLGMKSIWT